MNFTELSQQFIHQLAQTTIIEMIAVAFGVASVLLAKGNNVLLYPTGIVSTGIYIYLLATTGLYAESALNGYYLVMSIYGWMLWQRGHENENPKAISRNTRKDWIITAAIVSIGWVVLYTALSSFTNSDVPIWDAIVSATAWAGMWLLAKHKIENWLLLNISNFIAIPLFIHKGIPFTALLTMFLFIVAIFGFLQWRKSYQTQQRQSSIASS